ncbi:hypothetical protein D3C87_2109130 [compost metagenome]
MAGAKIVQRQTQPQIAQRLQHIGGMFRIGHHLALGDFQLEVAGQVLVLADQAPHVVEQRLGRQLGR